MGAAVRVGIEVVQVVAQARDSVTAKDQVGVSIHDVNTDHRLALRVTQHKMQYRGGKAHRLPRCRCQDQRGTRLAQGAEAAGRGQPSTDEVVHRTGVERDSDLPWVLRDPEGPQHLQ